MIAARLYGPRDLRVEEIPNPSQPGRGEVSVRVTSIGVCGSDLHAYQDGRLGETSVAEPLILGHEFAGVVDEVGPEAEGGNFQPLHAGMRVAIDPAQPCGHCEMCEQGNPNLCWHLKFCGLYPDNGCFCERIVMPARCCFPLPETIDDASGALLEPLGVALHAVDLSRIRVGDSVAIIGAGPIGLLILQMARLAGAGRVFVTERLPWRLALAQRLGAATIDCSAVSPVAAIHDMTHGRGTDIVIEAAWADESVQQAAEIVRLGGRLTLVGIPADDRLAMRHSTARRKGLTVRLCRRMKHTYPRAIELAASGRVDLHNLISHRFPIVRLPEAFALNAAYRDHVVKVIIDTPAAPGA